MDMARLWIPLLASCLFLVQSTPIALDSSTVTLDGATFQGSTSGPISSFLGIPFAEPP